MIKVQLKPEGLELTITVLISPPDVLDLMKALQNGLFDWHKLTGKRISKDPEEKT